MRENRILEGFSERLRQRRRAHAENRRPFRDLEDVGRDESFELVGGEGRTPVDEPIGFQKQPECEIRNFHDPRLSAGRGFDGADQFDIIDLLLSADVEGLMRSRRFDASGDDVAKIADVQRLTQIPAVSRYREHGGPLHEARKPPEVFAVEPAEHESRSQHGGRQPPVHDEAFLRLLRFCVEILRSRVHHRRADMHDLPNAVPCRCIEDVLRRGDVVVDERLLVEAADLRMADDEHVETFESPFPGAGPRQIGIDHVHVRVQLHERLVIHPMLVQADDPAELLRLQARNEILSEQAGRAGDDNLSLVRQCSVL